MAILQCIGFADGGRMCSTTPCTNPNAHGNTCTHYHCCYPDSEPYAYSHTRDSDRYTPAKNPAGFTQGTLPDFRGESRGNACNVAIRAAR